MNVCVDRKRLAQKIKESEVKESEVKPYAFVADVLKTIHMA